MRKELFVVVSLLCLMLTPLLVSATGAKETVGLGPARISMDLSAMGNYRVEKEDPSSEDHKFGNYSFSYTLYPASIMNADSSTKVKIEVHEMEKPEPLNQKIPDLSEPVPELDDGKGLTHCVAQSALLPKSKDVRKETYTIDGSDGIMATAYRDSAEKVPVYIVAWSPDQKDGSGKIICIISSDLPWGATKALFDSVNTQLA